MKRDSANVRQQILDAGLKVFADQGYQGASVHDIIKATKVTKPVLYYYFKNKAGLYKALVTQASDEAFRLMTEAAAQATGLEAQLVEIFAAMFEFLEDRRDLVRLGFRAAFSAAGELPEPMTTNEKGGRLLELVHSLIKKAQQCGNLDQDASSLELANGIYGALCFHLMAGVTRPAIQLNREAAERVVRLFLKGAEPRRNSA